MLARRLLSATAAVLLLVVAAALLVLGRPGTLRYAADWLSFHSRGQLAFEGVQGSLLATIYVQRLRWRVGSSEAVFEDVELDWSPWSLLDGTLAFQQAKARSARLFVASSRPGLPTTPGLPLKLRFGEVAVGQVIVRRHEPVEFVEASLTEGSSTAGVRADGFGSAAPPFPVVRRVD